MTIGVAPAIDEAYRKRVTALREQVARILRSEFREAVDPDDISASYAAFLAEAVPLLEAGQETAQALAAAYVASLAALADEDPFEPRELDIAAAGTTSRGKGLFAAFSSIGPMMLLRIGDGTSVRDALAYGEHLLTGAADAEVRASADDEADRQARESRTVIGWEGLVSPGSCDPCLDNLGTHDLAEDIYRHPNCLCEKRYVFVTT